VTLTDEDGNPIMTTHPETKRATRTWHLYVKPKYQARLKELRKERKRQNKKIKKEKKKREREGGSSKAA
jgi:hypothetical protein